MNTLEIWLTIVLLAFATILTRSSFFLLANVVRLPDKVQHALRYAPAIALAAIVAPDLAISEGTFRLDWMNPKLFAAAGAVLFFVVTRHLLGTIIVGMALFTAFRLTL